MGKIDKKARKARKTARKAKNDKNIIIFNKAMQKFLEDLLKTENEQVYNAVINLHENLQEIELSDSENDS